MCVCVGGGGGGVNKKVTWCFTPKGVGVGWGGVIVSRVRTFIQLHCQSYFTNAL